MQLKEYLFVNMLTQEEFAKKAECTRNYISMVCRGRSYPSRKLAKKIYKLTRGQVRFDDPDHIRPVVGRPRKIQVAVT